MTTNPHISESLRELIGKPAWGLKRSHGSMFFLEIGEAIHHGKTRDGRDRIHGEWHFLFELCDWSFSGTNLALISSNNEVSQIDAAFDLLTLGNVLAVSFEKERGELTFEFSSAIFLHVSPYTSEAEFDDTEWIFFLPDKFCWNKTKTTLSFGSTEAPQSSIDLEIKNG